MIVNFGRKSDTNKKQNPFGRSFKGLTKYLLHDKDQANTDERVGFTHLINFAPTEAKTVWDAMRIMVHTSKFADALKAANGGSRAGAKGNGKDVFHFNVDWPKWMKPDQEHMLQSAKDCLRAIGLSEELGYQAFIIEHVDTDHSHVHIVVNLIHPETGTKLYLDHYITKAQLWIKEYERAFEQSHPDRPEAATTTEPGKKKSFDRKEWAARKAANGNGQNSNKEEADRIRAEFASRGQAISDRGRAEFKKQREHGENLWLEYQQSRKEIRAKYQPTINLIAKHKRNKNALPLSKNGLRDWLQTKEWKKLSRQLYREARTFQQNERTHGGRMANAIAMTFASLSDPRTKGGRLTLFFNLVANARRREEFFFAKQDAAKKALAAKHNQQRQTRLNPVKQAMQKELAAAASQFKAQQSLGRSAADIRRQQQKQAWAALAKDRAAAWEALNQTKRRDTDAQAKRGNSFQDLLTAAHRRAAAAGQSLSPNEAHSEARRIRLAEARLNLKDISSVPRSSEPVSGMFNPAAANEEKAHTPQGWKKRSKTRAPRNRDKKLDNE